MRCAARAPPWQRPSTPRRRPRELPPLRPPAPPRRARPDAREDALTVTLHAPRLLPLTMLVGAMLMATKIIVLLHAAVPGAPPLPVTGEVLSSASAAPAAAAAANATPTPGTPADGAPASDAHAASAPAAAPTPGPGGTRLPSSAYQPPHPSPPAAAS